MKFLNVLSNNFYLYLAIVIALILLNVILILFKAGLSYSL